MIVVSTHLDDAVLSCAEFIQENQGALIVTVFAGIPGELPLTKYDVDCGFRSGTEAVTRRRAEDSNAAAVLGAWCEHLGFFDRQYGIDTDPQALLDAFTKRFGYENGSDPEPVVLPLGIEHPDHETVSRLAAQALADVDYNGRVLFYEDLPNRVHRPQLVHPARSRLRHAGWNLAPVPLHDAVPRDRERLAAKRTAIWCYRSQLSLMDIDSCLVPERIFEARRK
jgi:LmbE family N-acetylglucosaminyl deacetylase